MIRIALGLAKPARNLTLGCLLLATAALGVAAARAYPTTDLFCFTTAARLLTLGGDPYDAATWAAATAGTFPDYRGVPRSSPCPGRFGYPLWTAFAILPVTWLDPFVGALAWQLLLFLATGLGVVALARAVGKPEKAVALGLVVVSSQPFWLTVLNAQFGGVLLGAVGISASMLAARRYGSAGLALGFGWLKPHVVVLALAALPIRALARHRQRMAFAIVGVFALLLVISLAFRPTWPLEYATELLGNRRAQTETSTSLIGLSMVLTGSALFGLVVALAAIVVAAVLIRGRDLTDVEALSLAVGASLVASPYLGSHDQLLLAPCWMLLLRLRGWLGTPLVTLLAVAVPWSLYAMKGSIGGPEGLSGLVPTITLLAVAFTLRRESQVPRRTRGDVAA